MRELKPLDTSAAEVPKALGLHSADSIDTSLNAGSNIEALADNSLSTVGAANVTTAVANAISQAASSYYSTKVAKYTAEAQARIQEANARKAELSALSALNQSQWRIMGLTQRAGQIKSAQKGAMAANGIRIGVGSSARVLATTDIMKEIDVNNEYANGYRAAWGYRIQGTQSNLNAMASRSYAKSASALGSGMASLSGGLLQAYNVYQKETK